MTLIVMVMRFLPEPVRRPTILTCPSSLVHQWQHLLNEQQQQRIHIYSSGAMPNVKFLGAPIMRVRIYIGYAL